MQDRAIAIIDSGSGGLSLYKQLYSLLPQENITYIADTKHIPYGALSPDQIRERIFRITESLSNEQVKALVIACNTATAHAIDQLRNKFDLPIFGIEPPLKPAALMSKSGTVGVLATAATISSERFRKLTASVTAKVIVQSCPGLADAIEFRSDGLSKLLVEYLEPIVNSDADVLALGCTHYELVTGRIADFTENRIQIFEPSTGTLRRLHSKLTELGLLKNDGVKGTATFYSTGEADSFRNSLTRWFNEDHPVLSIAV